MKEALSEFRKAVNRAIQTFAAHDETRGCRLVSISEAGAKVELRLNVTMPFAYRAVGQSPNGVRNEEEIAVLFRPDYPWSSPRFFLREGFDRQLPHIQPGKKSQPPEPCLVDGSLDEYFYEAGLLALVEQLCDWLQKAATQSLINKSQGWEPTLRNHLAEEFIADASVLRGLADSRGGARVFKTFYLRSGDAIDQLGGKAQIFGQIETESLRLHRLQDGSPLRAKRFDHETTAGDSIAIVAWQGTHGGLPVVTDTYQPEIVETIGDLLVRAEALHCVEFLLEQLTRLDTVIASSPPDWPIPVLVLFCVRRPFHIIGSDSSIELIPYAFEIRPDSARQPIAKQAELTVVPIAQRDAISKTLLRQVSGSTPPGPISILGCGSVGSKFALHLARSGAEIASVIDSSRLQPHNMARHALLVESPMCGKATQLASALKQLDQNPEMLAENIMTALSDKEKRERLGPPGTSFAIDSTASLRVRSRLSQLTVADFPPRIVSTALFAQGHGGYMMIEGIGRTPAIDDLMAEYYRLFIQNPQLRRIATQNDEPLESIATGQGCGSLTMRMSDARVSAMTAKLCEKLLDRHHTLDEGGQLIIALDDEETETATWLQTLVHAPIVVDFEGNPEWTFRIQPQVVERIRQEVAAYPTVETGGVLMGRANDRLHTISVVDVLPAPPDSERSAHRFRLGVEGLKRAIEQYHDRSGKTLYDVGTWHSHLAEQGPSSTDEATAKELAGTRPPPFGLLIATPANLYGVMQADD